MTVNMVVILRRKSQMPKQSKSTTIVIRDNGKQANNKKNSKKSSKSAGVTSRQRPTFSLPYQPRSSTEYLRLRCAFADPFHPDAIGVKGPCGLSANATTTYHVKCSFAIRSNATGQADLMFYPTTGVMFLQDQGTTTPAASQFPFGSLSQTFSATTDAAISAIFDEYRVVSAGIKLKNLIPFNTITGYGIYTPTPCARLTTHNQDTLTTMGSSSAAFSNIMQSAFGGSSLLTNGSNVIPGAEVITSDELVNKSFQFSSIPTDPRAWDFYSSSNQTMTAGATYAPQRNQGLVIAAGGGALQTTKQMESCNAAGHSALAMNFNGLPYDTDCYLVDVILHLEGRPYITSSLSSSNHYLAASAAGNSGLTEAMASAAQMGASVMKLAAPTIGRLATLGARSVAGAIMANMERRTGNLRLGN